MTGRILGAPPLITLRGPFFTKCGSGTLLINTRDITTVAHTHTHTQRQGGQICRVLSSHSLEYLSPIHPPPPPPPLLGDFIFQLTFLIILWGRISIKNLASSSPCVLPQLISSFSQFLVMMIACCLLLAFGPRLKQMFSQESTTDYGWVSSTPRLPIFGQTTF